MGKKHNYSVCEFKSFLYIHFIVKHEIIHAIVYILSFAIK